MGMNIPVGNDEPKGQMWGVGVETAGKYEEMKYNT